EQSVRRGAAEGQASTGFLFRELNQHQQNEDSTEQNHCERQKTNNKTHTVSFLSSLSQRNRPLQVKASQPAPASRPRTNDSGQRCGTTDVRIAECSANPASTAPKGSAVHSSLSRHPRRTLRACNLDGNIEVPRVWADVRDITAVTADNQ